MYNFDEIIDRTNTNSSSEDGFIGYVFGKEEAKEVPYAPEDLVRMWVADMGFATPDFVREAVKERLDRKILGYTDWALNDSYYNCVKDWCKRRYNLDVNKNDLFVSAGVVPALKTLVGLIGKEGENVVIFTPSYTPFKAAAEYNGLNAVYSRLVLNNGKYTIDFEDF